MNDYECAFVQPDRDLCSLHATIFPRSSIITIALPLPSAPPTPLAPLSCSPSFIYFNLQAILIFIYSFSQFVDLLILYYLLFVLCTLTHFINSTHLLAHSTRLFITHLHTRVATTAHHFSLNQLRYLHKNNMHNFGGLSTYAIRVF